MAQAKLEVEQLNAHLRQTQIQLASGRDTLAMNQGILNDLRPLTKVGALSRLQYLQQQQEVRKAQSEVEQLLQEQERLTLEISEAKSKLQNTLALLNLTILAGSPHPPTWWGCNEGVGI